MAGQDSAGQRAARPPRVGDRIADAVIWSLIRGLLALPYRTRVRAMGWIVARVIGPVAGYRRRAMVNLALIYPAMPRRARARIARAALDNFGRTLIETWSGPEFTKVAAAAQVSGPGLAALDEARDAGRAVIFVTGHFGNHEAARHALTARGFRIGGIYRAMSNPLFNARYVRTLDAVSGPVFEKGAGTRGFVRHLRDGGMATILFDVFDRSGPALPFLGQPAQTATSAADLALRFDAVVIPYFGIRAPDGIGFDIRIEAPIPAADPVAMMTDMTRRLEARIAADPGQWFWIHRRWKTGRGPRQSTRAEATIGPASGD